MEEICRECGFDQSETLPSDVATELSPMSQAIGASVLAISGDELRRRPAATVWSPLEYLGHLRESMAFHRWLIECALSENNPLIPAVDPDESVAQSAYNDADPHELLAQFERRIQRLADALIAMDDDSADHPVTLDGREISVALVARSAWHECHHHLGDIRRLGGLDP
ncbi:MFS transporter [Mycolicibacterium gilvum]|uniref:MFS transporter n=2 Tax=Mycolicibacterium gilvum TaxID=1804 RepID=A0A378SYK8_9MYCO|nr:DinB family protein [Mycolicibacterium gilvum]STZ46507.1 MFS transporter [Mycolicibacterium gilvum]